MKLTKSQGIACLKALEKIERGEWDGENLLELGASCYTLRLLGWGEPVTGLFEAHSSFFDGFYNQSQVATALAMCVTVSGLELRYE